MIKAFVEELRPLVEARNHLARKAETGFAIQVGDITREGCKDPKRIEWLLSCMLDFGFDDRILVLFKKLCRYYYAIDPEATASYVYSYREMWDKDYMPEGRCDAEAHSSNDNTIAVRLRPNKKVQNFNKMWYKSFAQHIATQGDFGLESP